MKRYSIFPIFKNFRQIRVINMKGLLTSKYICTCYDFEESSELEDIF
jgi:hypothetical protein